MGGYGIGADGGDDGSGDLKDAGGVAVTGDGEPGWVEAVPCPVAVELRVRAVIQWPKSSDWVLRVRDAPSPEIEVRRAPEAPKTTR